MRTLASAPEPPPTLITLEELLRVWVAARNADAQLRPASQETYRKTIQHPIRRIGPLKLDALDHPTLESYRNARLGEGAAPRTVRHELVILRLAWRWAIGRELLHAATLPQVRVKTRGYVQHHRTPTEAEVAEVLGHMAGETLLAAQLLAVTGARLSEILDLRRRDVELSHGLLHMNGKVDHRTLPLTPGLRRLLAGRCGADDGRLLRTNRRQLRVALREGCAKAGVQVFTPHGIRRMAVNRLNRAGVDPKVAAAVTGHSVEIMLTVYRSVSAEEKAKGVRQAGLGQRLAARPSEGQDASGAQVGSQLA